MPRWWPNRADFPIKYWAQALGLWSLAVWGALIVLTALFEQRSGQVGHALGIALGTENPFASRGADVPAVALAVFSWLLIPAAIGAVVALVLEAQIRKARPLTKHEADERIEALEAELKRLQEERQGEADGSPGHA